MTRKIVTLSNPGDSAHVGTDDIDYINKYLTGVDQSIADPVNIATTTTFVSGKLNLKAPTTGNSFSIVTTDIVGNRNITIPLIASNDTLALAAYANTFTGLNTFSAGISLTSGSDVTLSAASDIVLDTVTGTKFGTATTQKLGFYNVAPIVQPAAITAPTGGTTIDTQSRTAISSLITTLHNLGLTA